MVVLDGEVAVYDEQLVSRFEWMRRPPPDGPRRLHASRQTRARQPPGSVWWEGKGVTGPRLPRRASGIYVARCLTHWRHTRARTLGNAGCRGAACGRCPRDSLCESPPDPSRSRTRSGSSLCSSSLLSAQRFRSTTGRQLVGEPEGLRRPVSLPGDHDACCSISPVPILNGHEGTGGRDCPVCTIAESNSAVLRVKDIHTG